MQSTTFEKHVIFSFFNAEAWGFSGSQRLNLNYDN